MLLGTTTTYLHLISATLLTMAISAADTRETIRLIIHSPRITTEKRLVTIGDLASITGGTDFQRKQISQLDLDILSAESPSLTVSRKQVEIRILLAGITETQPLVSGPETVEVQLREIAEIQERMESIVRRELTSQFGLQGENVTVKLLDNRLLNRLGEQLDLENVNGTAIFPAHLPMGRQQVQLELNDAQGKRYSVKLNFRIVIVRDVLITRQTIAKGTVLTANYFQQTRRPIDNEAIQLASLDQLVGKVAARNLASNVLLQTNFIMEPSPASHHVVKRNAYVDLVQIRGNLSIRLKNVKVLTPGAVGDVVEVLNTSSNKKLIATVKDKSTVVVR